MLAVLDKGRSANDSYVSDCIGIAIYLRLIESRLADTRKSK